MPRPRQLSFDELDETTVHTPERLIAGDTLYHARCSCGWVSAGSAAKSGARGLFTSHLRRTPYGQRAVSAVLPRAGRL